MDVKIKLDKDETIEEAEETLFKALNIHRTGEAHSEDYPDPAMRDLRDQISKKHEIMVQSMIREISDALDEDFNHG